MITCLILKICLILKLGSILIYMYSIISNEKIKIIKINLFNKIILTILIYIHFGASYMMKSNML